MKWTGLWQYNYIIKLKYKTKNQIDLKNRTYNINKILEQKKALISLKQKTPNLLSQNKKHRKNFPVFQTPPSHKV